MYKNETFSYDDVNVWFVCIDLDIGENCTYNEECEKVNPGISHCDEDVCKCKPGYMEVDIQGKRTCVKEKGKGNMMTDVIYLSILLA